ncbi:MAG TPA: fumarylacetoacetate hydrolase family protein [Azospirillaceae bacterium]|nr:fumarylacetoacetate hydrolase family protein [Azospirillaceae bacterium]
MKLATLKEGGRDGTLILVSFDLEKAVRVPDIAPTLQAALDDWAKAEPRLRERWHALNQHDFNRPHLLEGVFALTPNACAAPLPRAYQWADGSAYLSHVERARKARGSEMPPAFQTDPLMYQGGSDHLMGATAPLAFPTDDWGIDFEAEVAAVTDDVPRGVSAEDARRHIKLLMLVNDVSLRVLAQTELAKGFGFFQSKPASACALAAVTPDSLGDRWDGGKLHLDVRVSLNGQPYGHPNAGRDATFDFPQLIAHAARTRSLGAGSIIGMGTVSNRDSSVGYACLVEKRMVEKVETGTSTTPFLCFGDRVRIQVIDEHGNDVFGAIDQEVKRE